MSPPPPPPHLHTTRGEDEPNAAIMRKSLQITQHGIQNVKTHNRTMKLNRWAPRTPPNNLV